MQTKSVSPTILQTDNWGLQTNLIYPDFPSHPLVQLIKRLLYMNDLQSMSTFYKTIGEWWGRKYINDYTYLATCTYLSISLYTTIKHTSKLTIKYKVTKMVSINKCILFFHSFPLVSKKCKGKWLTNHIAWNSCKNSCSILFANPWVLSHCSIQVPGNKCLHEIGTSEDFIMKYHVKYHSMF